MMSHLQIKVVSGIKRTFGVYHGALILIQVFSIVVAKTTILDEKIPEVDPTTNIGLSDLSSLNDSIHIASTGSPKDIHFFLYTTSNQIEPDELFINDSNSLTSSSFEVAAPVKVIIHGFMSGNNHSFPTDLRAAYLNQSSEPLNVITVDWSALAANPLYYPAAHNVPLVGRQTANLIQFLIEQNVVTLDEIHIIGHSLGAHASGSVGQHLRTSNIGQVPRISGLDPAKPLFEFRGPDHRLDKTDAIFVDIIHTNGGELGLFDVIGHVDFYPNHGKLQPGCLLENPTDLACSHSRAYQLYEESLSNPIGFRSCKCPDEIPFPSIPNVIIPTFPILLDCSCDNGPDSIAYMGENVSTSATGVFYLTTNGKPPYAKG